MPYKHNDSRHAHPHWKAALGNYQGLLAALGRDEERQQAEIEALMAAVKKRERC